MATKADSKWYATPNAKRKNKVVSLTLSDEARAILDEMANQTGRSRSEIADAIIRGELAPARAPQPAPPAPKVKLSADQKAMLAEIAAAGPEGLVLDKGIVSAGSLLRKGLVTREDIEVVPATKLYTTRAETHTLRGRLRHVTLSRYKVV